MVDLLDAARAGDADAFRVLVEPHRVELHSHCWRMLGSVHDADDAFQDATMRAWRGLPGLEDGTRLRPWLYKIATNTCLDVIRARKKRALPVDCSAFIGSNDVQGAHMHESRHETTEARYEQRESVERAFIAALRHLPGHQRAVLILREVLGFSAREVAELLETTLPSVNSALQRARTSVSERIPEPNRQPTVRALGDERLRDLVECFIDAVDTGDVDTMLAILAPAPLEPKA
jgi:RNA polymerase sigma-70 factor (ECF subfamily)